MLDIIKSGSGEGGGVREEGEEEGAGGGGFATNECEITKHWIFD